jgi:mRNA interferase HicA
MSGAVQQIVIPLENEETRSLRRSISRYIIQDASDTMKRRDLIKHLEKNGAALLREGGRHTIFQKNNRRTAIPRHSEIVEELASKICRDLDIPTPGK